MVDEGDVLTIARDRGSEGVSMVYVREDVPEVVDKVLPPEYLRVRHPSSSHFSALLLCVMLTIFRNSSRKTMSYLRKS